MKGSLFSLGKSWKAYLSSPCNPINKKTSLDTRISLKPNALTNAYRSSCLMNSECIAGAKADVPGLLFSRVACFCINSVGDKSLSRFVERLWKKVRIYFDLKYGIGDLRQMVICGDASLTIFMASQSVCHGINWSAHLCDEYEKSDALVSQSLSLLIKIDFFVLLK